MEQEFVVLLKSGAELFAPSTLARLTRLRQIALEPAIIDVAAESSKTSALIDLLNDIEGKVVVFSWFASYLRFFDQLLEKVNHRIITGDNPETRHQARVDFQDDPDVKVLLASIGAGGVGIDLHSAQIAIFTDVFWTPALNTQAEDRLHRIGQKGNVLIIRLIHPNTIDEDMHRVLKRKARAFNETMAIKEAVSSMLRRHPDD